MYLTDVFTLVYIQIETNNTQQIMNKLDVFSLFFCFHLYILKVYFIHLGDIRKKIVYNHLNKRTKKRTTRYIDSVRDICFRLFFFRASIPQSNRIFMVYLMHLSPRSIFKYIIHQRPYRIDKIMNAVV